MKKLVLPLIILLLAFSTQLSAQKMLRKFGTVTKEDMEYQSYPDEPDAEAVVMFDMGESVFYESASGGFDIRFTRTRRIKVLNKQGVKYAEVEIPFYMDGYGKTERVTSIEAHTINFETGRVQKKEVSESEIYEEQINNNWYVKKFVFPDVKEGSIIEYRYKIETPFHFNLPDWQFQDFIPTLFSQYKVRMIPFYEYVFLVNGTNRFDIQRSEVSKGISRRYAGIEFQDYVHTYGMKNVPSFKDESYMTSSDDYIMKMDFQLAKFHRPTGGSSDIISTWPELTKELIRHENFGKYIKKSEKVADKVLEEELTVIGNEEIEKSRQIIDYVKQSYDWNERYGKYASQSVKDFYKTKSGSVSEINLFTIGMLRAAGITARPVILSTRSHGKVNKNYPFTHFFNYVVILVEIGDGLFLADATDQRSAFNRLPVRCLNDDGLIVEEGNPKWVGLRVSTTSVNSKTLGIRLDEEKATSEVTLSLFATEYEAWWLKNSYNDQEESLTKYLEGKGFDDVKEISTTNFESSQKPYRIKVVGEADIERIDDKLIVNPFLDFPLAENRLKQKERSYPVDFMYPWQDRFISIIEIPENFKVLEMPENFEIKSDLAEIEFTCKENGGMVHVIGTCSFKKAIYQPNEYARIRFYLDNMVEKFNQQVVFERI